MKTGLRVLLALGVATALSGCGGTEVKKRDSGYIDQMHFVDDSAVEPVRPRPKRQPSTTAKFSNATHGVSLKARCANDKQSAAVSEGRASNGRLLDGCELPARGTGYERKNRNGWGTDQTVALVQWASSQVVSLYPKTVRVVVGAISRQHGGRLGKHKSHQSGRDVDIGYFASNNRALPHFRRMGPGNLDVQKSWALIGALLSTGRVQYIFMDYNLQALFHQFLRDRGTQPHVLARIFQFPAGRAVRRGIIRHARGHADHFHVRFRCPVPGEDGCVE